MCCCTWRRVRTESFSPVETNLGGQLAHNVALGAHVGRVPAREGAVVHAESVVVFGDRDDVLGTCALEQIGPLRRVKLLGPKERHKVLVAEFGVRPPCFEVVLMVARALDVHVARVPLVAKGGHRVDAPVDKDAEFGVLVPLGHAELPERFPGGLVC